MKIPLSSIEELQEDARREQIERISAVLRANMYQNAYIKISTNDVYVNKEEQNKLLLLEEI